MSLHVKLKFLKYTFSVALLTATNKINVQNSSIWRTRGISWTLWSMHPTQYNDIYHLPSIRILSFEFWQSITSVNDMTYPHEMVFSGYIICSITTFSDHNFAHQDNMRLMRNCLFTFSVYYNPLCRYVLRLWNPKASILLKKLQLQCRLCNVILCFVHSITLHHLMVTCKIIGKHSTSSFIHNIQLVRVHFMNQLSTVWGIIT